MDNLNQYHQDNKNAWNVTAAIYEENEAGDIALLRGGGSSLLEQEKAVLGDLREWCGRAIHLQCAAGLDTLSLLNQGAKEVVGVDISPRMIASARRKSDALGANAVWFCADVLAAPPELDGAADLVHTGRGALNWMMDLDAWAGVVQRLLKPGGRLHIFEGHPLDWVWDAAAPSYQFHPVHGDYFDQAPGGGEIWPLPYIQRQEEVDPATIKIHDHQWTLGQMINSLIRAGLVIDYFNEYPQPFWNQFENIPGDILRRLPHTYSLVAKKPKS